MSYLFDFGEVIFCFGPVFLVISAIGLTLLWNSWPSQKLKEEDDVDSGLKEEGYDNSK